MKTQCPKCGYEGDIKDDLVPEGGRTVGCPQCKATFTVKRNSDAEKSEKSDGGPREVEVDGREFIPFRRRETRVAHDRADRPVIRITVLALSFSAVLILGFLVGRYTHDYSLTNPLKKKEGAPVAVMTPTAPLGDRAETAAVPDAPAAPGEVPGGDTVQPSGPLLLEESFTSDVFIDITEIDGKLTETTDVTGLQRELELKEFAGGLVGNMLVGYFIIRDVGKLDSVHSNMFPLSLYSYYLEAEGDSSESIKSIIYVGLKQADELSSTLDKGSMVYIQGFIYSCTLVFDHFELGIANPRVELSR